MNLFTISSQAVTSDRRAGHGNTFNLRRFVGGLLAALTGVVMAFSAPSEAYAQQCLTGGCTLGTNVYPSAVQSTSSSAFTAVATNIWAGESQRYNVVSGETYEWSLCTADGGNASYDSQLTLFEVGGAQICYSDDFCGDDPKISWTATFTGEVRTQVNVFNCGTNSTNTTLVWRQSSAAPPVSPCAAPNVVGALPVVAEAIVCDGTNDFTSINVANVCGSTNYYGGQEALYSFTPANTADYNITISGQSWTGIMVYDACPLTGACVGFIQNSSSAKTLTVSLTAGVEYFIIFDTYPTPNSPCPGTYSISEVVPPPACTENTVFLDMFDGFSDGWDGTTYTITTFPGGSTVATGTLASGGSQTDELCLADGCYNITVGGGSFLNEKGWTLSGVDGGPLVYPIGSGAPVSVNFSINGGCPPPPPLAWCASATPIACGGSVSGSTVGAPTEPIPATCGTTNGSGGKVGYIFTGTGVDVIADLSGSGYDTKVWVFEYSGGCQPGDLVCVGGDDDGGTGTTSLVQFFGASGQDYLIVVGGFSSNEGAYVLNVLCGPFGCTDPAACNYDAGAATNDGSCFYVCNDLPSGAIALAVTSLGTCSPLAQDMNDATTNFGGFLFGFGNDLWYSFTAVTSGVRVEVSTSTVDAMVEVRDAATNSLVEFEDALFVNGSEILNFGGLTAGEDYLIRVADYNSGSTSRPFDICVQFLPDTQCDLNVGVTSIERSLCQNAKADWVTGATNYIFHFTPVGGGSTITYETGAAFTIAPLQNVPGLVWGTTYDIEIDLALNLTNSAGTSEAITVLGSNACELVIVDAPTAALRSSDNLANAGPLPLGAYVAATPWVCTATEWEWVFSNTNGSQLPIVHFSGAPSRFIRLSDVSGLNAGDVYNVQVRPVFATGYEGAFGATEQIAIIGALGMVEDVTSPVGNTEIDERVEETVVAAGVALYPNPNRGDFVNVNIANVAEGVDRVIFDLYDLTGKRVISEQIAVAGSGVNVVMPLNGLADGMYIANIIIGEEVHTERIAVQK